MLLRLKRSESALLLLHMAMMRKNARNTFKKNQKKESKELLQSFDDVKNALESVIEQTDETQGNLISDYHFNVREIKLIYSFLDSYLPLLENTVKRAGESEEDMKQIEILQTIKKANRELLKGANVAI